MAMIKIDGVWVGSINHAVIEAEAAALEAERLKESAPTEPEQPVKKTAARKSAARED